MTNVLRSKFNRDAVASFTEGLSALPGRANRIFGETSKLDEVFITDVSGEDSSSECGAEESHSRRSPNCLRVSLLTLGAIATVCLVLVLGRGYIKWTLVWLENADVYVSLLVCVCLFTIVSFPMTWGYLLLNVAVGYLFGAAFGTLVVAGSASVGILFAHLVIRRFFVDSVIQRLQSHSLLAVIRVVQGPQGFKVVALSRLTPIPFGLQNGLFAITDISTPKYLLASMLGLLPTQGLHAYIGSTLRSMEDVLTDEADRTTGYIVFSTQLLLTVFLMLYVVRRARMELKRTVEEHEELEEVKMAEEGKKMTVDMNENSSCSLLPTSAYTYHTSSATSTTSSSSSSMSSSSSLSSSTSTGKLGGAGTVPNKSQYLHIGYKHQTRTKSSSSLQPSATEVISYAHNL